MSQDRLEQAFRGAVAGAMRPIDYAFWYPARVVAMNADGTVDLAPDDADLVPTMQHVPLRLGVPGLSVIVPVGARVLVGFEGGDPGRPVATVWEGTTGVQLVINGGTDFVALASKVDAQITALKDVFSSWTPVASDGGAALKVLLTSLLGSGWPHSTASSSVKST